nr:MAG TPA: hypothetical protein [Caudoviricetes sp.]
MTSEMLSHLAHAGLALAAQIVVAVAAALCGASLPAAACLGALFSVGFYWGREVAQVERHAGTPPWWSGFDPRNWQPDNWGDFLAPLVACSAAALAVFLTV